MSEDMLLGSGAQRAVALVWHRWSSDGGSSVVGGGAFMVCKLRVQCVFDKLRQRLRTAVNIASSVDGQPEESSRVILAANQVAHQWHDRSRNECHGHFVNIEHHSR